MKEASTIDLPAALGRRMQCEVCLRHPPDVDVLGFKITVPWAERTKQFIYSKGITTCGSKSCLHVAQQIVSIREADMR